MGKLSALWDIAAKPVAGAAAIGASVAPEDAEAGVITKVDDATGAVKRMIEAWHGSPHSFDKFDISKIGTGEGAQAYGHGLYFADAKETAGEYRKKLTSGTFRSSDGSVFDAASVIKNPNVRTILERTDGDIDAAIARARQSIEAVPGTQGAEYAAADLVTLEKMKESGGIARPQGAMYRTHIDVDPDTLLDYDKPLSEQPPVAQSALRDMWQKSRKSFQQLDPEGNPTAGQVMHIYSQHRGGNSAAVSEELRGAGIPGVRYLDEQSRNITPPKVVEEGGQFAVYWGNDPTPAAKFSTIDEAQAAAKELDTRTSNYVMFDDKPISIVERGFADPALLGAIGVGAATTTALAPEMYRQMEETRRVLSDFATLRAPKASFWQQKRQELIDLVGAGVGAAVSAGINTVASNPVGAAMLWQGGNMLRASEEPVRGVSALTALIASGDLNTAANVARMPQEAIADEAGGLVTDYLSQAGYPRAGALAGTAANVGINMAGF